MTRTVFWDVDTQHDFIMPEGKLYIQGAETILATGGARPGFPGEKGLPLRVWVVSPPAGDGEFSARPDFRETFPPHCLAGTPGQEKVAATRPANPLFIDSRPEDKVALK